MRLSQNRESTPRLYDRDFSHVIARLAMVDGVSPTVMLSKTAPSSSLYFGTHWNLPTASFPTTPTEPRSFSSLKKGTFSLKNGSSLRSQPAEMDGKNPTRYAG